MTSSVACAKYLWILSLKFSDLNFKFIPSLPIRAIKIIQTSKLLCDYIRLGHIQQRYQNPNCLRTLFRRTPYRKIVEGLSVLLSQYYYNRLNVVRFFPPNLKFPNQAQQLLNNRTISNEFGTLKNSTST